MNTTPINSLNKSTLRSRIDTAIERALAEQRIVGAVAVVAQHGEVLYRRAHGFADREAQQKMTESTLFRLASVTKPFVALAALRLIAQGKLTLETPVKCIW